MTSAAPTGLVTIGRQAWRNRGARALAAVHLVDCVGNGVYFGTFALYLRQVVQLSSIQVGVLLGAGSVLGLVASLGVGRATDRADARAILTCLLAAIGATFAVMQVSAGHEVVVASCALIATALHFCCPAPFVTLIGANFGLVPPGMGRAFVRSIGNLGMAAGAAGAAVVLASLGQGALRYSPGLDALSFLLAAVGLRWVASSPVSTAKAETRRRHAIREPGMVIFVAATAFAGLHSSLLSIGFPLWIATDRHLPVWIAPALVGINTAMVFFFQVRAAAIADRGDGSAVAATRAAAGLVVAAAVGLWVSPIAGAALAVLVGAYVLVTVAELLQNAAFFHFTFSLGPESRRAEYASALHVSQIAESAIGPAAFGFVLQVGGGRVWLVAAGVMTGVILVYKRAFLRLEASS